MCELHLGHLAPRAITGPPPDNVGESVPLQTWPRPFHNLSSENRKPEEKPSVPLAAAQAGMGQSLSRCTCLMSTGPCEACSGTGVCKSCGGKGYVIAKHDIEVFSYVLDKKGAYREVKEAPKQCTRCGGWGGAPNFRGINHSVAPSGALQEGGRKRMGESGGGDGKCRSCKGAGTVLVQPEWMREQIAAATPPKFEVGGMLMTSPQKKGPLRIGG